MKFLTLDGLTYYTTKIKALINGKVDKDGAKVLSDNNYSTQEKEKLAGVAASANNYTHPNNAGNKHIPTGGAAGQILGYGGSSGTASWMSNAGQANVIETVKVNGTALTPASKAVNIDLSDYAKKTDISTVYIPKGSVANYAALPKSSQRIGDVYNLEDTGSNYVWLGSGKGEKGDGWDKLGETIDLSGYVKASEIQSITTAEIDALFS